MNQRNVLFTAYHKMGTKIVRTFQKLVGIKTLGARAIVINKQNEILLVKHTYQHHWYLPGGGVKKGESVKTALLRELKEEVGVIPNEPPQLYGVYFHSYLGVNDYPIIFIVKNFTLINANSPEIEEINWVRYEKLPAMISPGTKRRLTEYFLATPQLDKW